MNAEIDRVFTRLTSEEVLARLDAAQIANARINTVEQFMKHPQLEGRASWRDVASPVGPVPALIPPVRMDDVEPRMDAIPELWQHS
jgi:crotonobetainyl-CoA:carnitine CoA-transferase CaiB-like acyl-CoA transferase